MGAKLDKAAQSRKYEADRNAEKNSPTGFVTAFFAVVTALRLIWHIWWLAALGAFGAFMTFLAFAFRRHDEIEIPASGLPGSIGVTWRRLRHEHRCCDRRCASRRAPACRRKLVRLQADRRGYGFWIFLLSDIVMFATLFCDLRGTRSVDGGRPDRRPVVQSR